MTAADQFLNTTTHRFVEAVDQHRARIDGRGHLTEQAADLIRGAVEMLCRSGHRRITLDLHAVEAADDEAVAALRSLALLVRARHGELVVLSDTWGESP